MASHAKRITDIVNDHYVYRDPEIFRHGDPDKELPPFSDTIVVQALNGFYMAFKVVAEALKELEPLDPLERTSPEGGLHPRRIGP